MEGACTRRTIIQAHASNIDIASIINPLMFRANDSIANRDPLSAAYRCQEGTNIIIFDKNADRIVIELNIHAPCRAARADMSIRVIDS